MPALVLTLVLILSLGLISVSCDHGEDSWLEVELVNRTESEMVEDRVWTSMVRLAWEDYISRINRDRAVYGVVLDPFNMTSMVDNSLNLSQSLLGYQVDLAMWNMSIHGLADLMMSDLKVMRSPGLNDVKFKMDLEIEQLELTGFYQMEAVSWLLADLSSEGVQTLLITINNVTISLETEVELARGCGQEGAMVREISIAWRYGQIQFEFNNIGSVMGTVVDVFGGALIERERLKLLTQIKALIQSEVKTLICQGEISALEDLISPLEVDQYEGPLFYDKNFRDFLQRESQSQLIRDR